MKDILKEMPVLASTEEPGMDRLIAAVLCVSKEAEAPFEVKIIGGPLTEPDVGSN